MLRNKGAKAPERKGKVLFINADREYYEGRAQNHLLPEHIEKIVSTYEAFAEADSFSRIVNLEELRENDYNLNIRRYADNAPPPEPQDVRSHLLGGIPLKEVQAKQSQLEAQGLDPMDLLAPRADEDDYVDFREDLADKANIKPAIEQDAGVRQKEARLKDTFESWWQQRGTQIAQLSGNGQQLSALRDDLIGTFTHALEPIGMLDRFAVRGIIAGFWDQNKNEFRTLQARGVLGVVDAWRTSIITLLEDDQNKTNPLDHKLVAFLLADYVAELEDLQARKAELDTRIKAATAQPEEDDDAEPDEDAPTETDIKVWKAERTKATKTLKAKQASFEAHLNEAVDALDEAGAAELMLTILHNDMLGILDTYIRHQRQEVIAAFETWWDKYRVTLADIETARDAATEELKGYLEGLGYA